MENESRPNENKSFNYVVSGQMYVGDVLLTRIEPKKGVSASQVEEQLRRDYKGFRVSQIKDNVLYIEGEPKVE